MEVKTQDISIKLIEANKGQIEGLPKNPRLIKDHKFEKLVKSIEENPEMLNMRELLVYPHGGKFIVIGGNMRLEALKKLGYKSAPCKVIPESATVEQLRAYTIKDNNGYGEWDFDLLAGEWDVAELSDWGLDFATFTDLDLSEPTVEQSTAISDVASGSALPEELQGIDVTPDSLPKIEGTNETEYERIIIVYPKEKKDALCAFLGVDDIEKIVYRVEELPAMGYERP